MPLAGGLPASSHWQFAAEPHRERRAATQPRSRPEASKSRNNVRKRGSTWTYYVYVIEGDGTRRQISKGGFPTRAAAEAARIEALHARKEGTFVRPERVTLAQFLLGEWLPTQRPPATEESTYRSYRRYVTLHVVPYIGAIQLQQLTAMDLNDLYRKLLESGRRFPTPPVRQHDQATVGLVAVLREKGLTWQQIADRVGEAVPAEAGISRNAVAALHRRQSNKSPRAERSPGLKPRTVRYIHTILHAALKDAMAWNRVARNVATAAKAPSAGSTRRGRPSAWTAEELGKFISFIADSRYLCAWVFLATVGCRRGEALGLKWADLDLDEGTAVLARQVTSVDHEIHIKPYLKASGGHLVALDPATIALLRTWRARQNEEKLLAGPGYVDDDFVFTHPDGSVYHPDRFSREFLRQQERFNAGHPDDPLPRLVLHGLRHTWATLALHEGIDIKVVSERLNHSSTTITREIYMHVTPPMKSDAADRVAARIFGPGAAR